MTLDPPQVCAAGGSREEPIQLGLQGRLTKKADKKKLTKKASFPRQ